MMNMERSLLHMKSMFVVAEEGELSLICVYYMQKDKTINSHNPLSEA